MLAFIAYLVNLSRNSLKSCLDLPGNPPKITLWPQVQDAVEIDEEFINLFTAPLFPPADPNPKKDSLFPMPLPQYQALALHHQKAFSFHFLGGKKTNQIQRPEWYLDWLLTLLQEHATFLEGLERIYEPQSKMIPLNEFIVALLCSIQEKVF